MKNEQKRSSTGNHPKGIPEMDCHMHTENIVQILLRNSREINQMEQDIRHLVGMIMGLAKEFKLDCGWSLIFEAEKCSWRVRITLGQDRLDVQADCLIQGEFGPESIYHWPENKHIAVKHVRLIHKNLPALVQGMVKKFPVLDEKLKPFMDV